MLINLTVTDAITFSESDSSAGDQELRVSDFLGLTESYDYTPKRFQEIVGDALVFLDSPKLGYGLFQGTLSDTLAFLEQIQHTQSPTRLIISDTIGFVELAQRLIDLSVSDSLTFADGFVNSADEEIDDTLNLVESWTVVASKGIRDTLTIVEDVCHSIEYFRSISDTLVFFEEEYSLPGPYPTPQEWSTFGETNWNGLTQAQWLALADVGQSPDTGIIVFAGVFRLRVKDRILFAENVIREGGFVDCES